MNQPINIRYAYYVDLRDNEGHALAAYFLADYQKDEILSMTRSNNHVSITLTCCLQKLDILRLVLQFKIKEIIFICIHNLNGREESTIQKIYTEGDMVL